MASKDVPGLDHPLLDVASALAPPPPFPPGVDPNASLASLHGTGAITPGALPLLVRMPDGERRQIEVPPTATVRDLRDQMPGDTDWDFNFNGQQMSDKDTLADYNIPDAYGHAGGLLRMISGNGNMDMAQKAEVLKNACNVVKHISRGETDMGKLISAAFDESATANNTAPGSPSQPSLQSIRRGKKSFNSLNFANLPPLERPPAGQVAPPTPSELMQKLSASRPDLYPPTPASRMLDLAVATPAAPIDPAFPGGAGGVAPDWHQEPGAAPFMDLDARGNGDLKRGNTDTWFSKLANSITPLPPQGSMDKVDVDAIPPNVGESEDDEKPPTDGAPNGYADANAGESEDEKLEPTPAETGVAPSSDAGAGSSNPHSTDGGTNGAGAASSDPPLRVPKKRGRKRKNPELSEEERKALRQAQNRASAKQSRLRRKEIAKEYQERVTTLEGENEHLRDTVAALSDRLQFLQNLLTVSVQKRPVN